VTEAQSALPRQLSQLCNVQVWHSSPFQWSWAISGLTPSIINNNDGLYRYQITHLNFRGTCA